jgi:hypothetical protein
MTSNIAKAGSIRARLNGAARWTALGVRAEPSMSLSLGTRMIVPRERCKDLLTERIGKRDKVKPIACCRGTWITSSCASSIP